MKNSSDSKHNKNYFDTKKNEKRYPLVETLMSSPWQIVLVVLMVLFLSPLLMIFGAVYPLCKRWVVLEKA